MIYSKMIKKTNNRRTPINRIHSSKKMSVKSKFLFSRKNSLLKFKMKTINFCFRRMMTMKRTTKTKIRSKKIRNKRIRNKNKNFRKIKKTKKTKRIRKIRKIKKIKKIKMIKKIRKIKNTSTKRMRTTRSKMTPDKEQNLIHRMISQVPCLSQHLLRRKRQQARVLY